MNDKTQIELQLVIDPTRVSVVQELFREYQAEINVDLSFQDFDSELDSLPGVYSPPRGRLYVATVDSVPAGCIGLRPLKDDRCEMKRLFIRPQFRGLKLGRFLSERVIDDARAIGYTSMVLDTLPSMRQAKALYRSLGFREIAPYRFNPIPGTAYMELVLS
jgi:ribosomal protein S18 acetylase RimI-like enzyme